MLLLYCVVTFFRFYDSIDAPFRRGIRRLICSTHSPLISSLSLSRQRFVKSLGYDDWTLLKLLGEDDDEDFVVADDDDDENDEDDDEDEKDTTATATATVGTKDGDSSQAEQQDHSNSENEGLIDDDHASFPDLLDDLEEELGWLEEEDMQAAVATLLDHQHVTENQNNNPGSVLQPGNQDQTTSEASVGPATTTMDGFPAGSITTITATPAAAATTTMATTGSNTPSTPLGLSSRGARMGCPVTQPQRQQLQSLLKQHYQMLLQQSVLCARAAHEQRTTSIHARRQQQQAIDSPVMPAMEHSDELAEILDAAVG
jgi:hypothetical protein